jgi:outer membrane receptor protein involved in Fe transport
MPVTVPTLPVPVRITGNRDLRAETIKSLEVGYLGDPLPNVTAGVTLYYNFIDDLIDYQQVPSLPGVIPMNQEDEEAYGFELEAEYEFTETLTGFGNYAFGIRREHRFAPRNKANLGVRLTEPIQAMLWLHYYDSTELFDVKVDDYVLVNGSLSYRFLDDSTKGSAFVRAFNLLDHDHREHPEGQEYGLILTGGVELSF